jgi:hypothetical protein
MRGLIGPRELDGFTYNIPGTGVGTDVEVGGNVAVGRDVCVAVTASSVAGAAAPHPESAIESKSNPSSIRLIVISIESW